MLPKRGRTVASWARRRRTMKYSPRFGGFWAGPGESRTELQAVALAADDVEPMVELRGSLFGRHRHAVRGERRGESGALHHAGLKTGLFVAEQIAPGRVAA